MRDTYVRVIATSAQLVVVVVVVHVDFDVDGDVDGDVPL
jgi:hypothetical protein